MPNAQKGFQLVELIVAMALLTSLLALGVPPLMDSSGDLRLSMAAGEVAGVLRSARSFAVRYDANVAVKFRTESNGDITFTLYRDGDGDGVLNRDIDAGTDPRVGPPQRLALMGRGTGFGFPPGPAPRDPSSPSHRLNGLDDPIRFNQSDLASFGSLGTATSGSAYVTDGVSRLAVVRVLNRTGRVRVLTYDSEEEVWRE